MRKTALRIFPARSPISAGATVSLVLSSRRAWPSMTVIGVRNSGEAMGTKLRCSKASRCSGAHCPTSHARLPRKRILAAHQRNGVIAEDHRRLGHGADLVLPLGRGHIDIGIIAGEPAHAVG